KFIRTGADKIIAVECLSPDTLVQESDGNIREIKDLPATEIATANFKNFKIEHGNAVAVVKRQRKNNEKVYHVQTGGMFINATGGHKFFTLTENGIESKPVSELKVGDWITEARRINVLTAFQHMPALTQNAICRITDIGLKELILARKKNALSQRDLSEMVGVSQATIDCIERGIQRPSLPCLKKILGALFNDVDGFLRTHVSVSVSPKRVCVPPILTPGLGQILGYLTGCGYISHLNNHHVYLKDKNKEVLKSYQKLAGRILGLRAKIMVDNQAYLILSSYHFKKYLEEHFPKLLITKSDRDVDSKILRSPKSVTKRFIRGLFDAQGIVDNNTISISMTASMVIRKMQLLLLRHNINSHLTMRLPDNSGHVMYKLQISGRDSILQFYDTIGFNHPSKKKKLINMLNRLKCKRKIPKRPQYPPIVKKLIRKKLKAKKIKIPSRFYGDSGGVTCETLDKAIQLMGSDVELNILRNSDLMWSKIRSITIPEKQPNEVWDVCVPGPANFIANGMTVHNSGGMFSRFVEEDVSNRFKALLVHTAGQAPRSTRRLIRRLSLEYNLPIYIFTDGDPWGVHIAMVIISGSAQAAHIRGLASPEAIWIGVWASDIIDYKLPSFAMTNTDIKRTEDLLRDPRYQSAFWQMQLQTFLKIKKKAEQQAFSKYSLDFVVDEYLPKKFSQIKKLQRRGFL
ncbi:MAG: LAGLIDADG family homing endonuclease, partial [Candidatus Ranarchaeia archaeon]